MSSGHSGIGRGLRFRILERDHFTCVYCGRWAPEVALEVDHARPVGSGGDDHPWNLVTACHDCNQGKRDRFDTTPHLMLLRDHDAYRDECLEWRRAYWAYPEDQTT